MTPFTYPASLPCFRWEPYGVAPRPGSLGMTIGMQTHRAMVYTENNEVIQCETILSSAQEQVFRTFFKTTLSMGTQWFTAPILRNGGIDDYEVMFLGAPPSYVPANKAGYVRARFTLLTRGDRIPPCEYVLFATHLPDFFGMSATVDPDTSSDMFPLTGLEESDELRITFPSGRTYIAWSRWSGYGGAAGQNPDLSAPLWENSFAVEYDTAISQQLNTTRYMTDALSLAAAQASEPIVLTGSTSYKFWLYDDFLFNRGGLSLKIEVWRLVCP